MALTFGVTVLPDPPYQRLIELIQLAERHGFEYGWTYDSHVLWQDSTGPLGHQLYDVVAVADRADAVPPPMPGLHAWRSGAWLVVAQATGEEGHSAARLDALSYEAARLTSLS